VAADTMTPSPWVLATEPTSLGDPTNLVTLVDGQTFCLSGRSGDLGANPSHGVFFADMRVLSEARLTVDGSPLEPLAVSPNGSDAVSFVGRSVLAPGTDRRLLVIRRRRLGAVLHEQIELRNTGRTPMSAHVALDVAADFADVFAVKEGRATSEGEHSVEVRDSALMYRWRLGDVRRQAELTVTGDAQVTPRGFSWTVVVEPRGSFVIEVDLAVALGTSWIQRKHHNPWLPAAASRSEGWHANVPSLRTSDRRLSEAFDRSLDDLGALRLHDPSGKRKPVIAAGAPWFMTLFGRDALITSYMALPIDPTLAIGVLEALAELQGNVSNDASEEEPGRIMHETRYLGIDAPTLIGGSTYYGTADATPLFVVLLGELSHWGLDDETLHRLLPHADRAIEWMEQYGDRDGDGYIEYEKSSPRGLANQGWKDSWDGIRYHDGQVAQAPIALCEVQGYAYAAYRARADIARRLGDDAVEARSNACADRLKVQFNRDFWVPSLGWFAVGLGKDKEPVDAMSSNIGHCLWSGIVDDEFAAQVAERLMSPEMWSGWGIRTMASDEDAYDPMSYHCGTVWPHDSALCAAGLRRYGFDAAAAKVADGLLDVADAWGGRLPELFSGIDRTEVGTPVPFPTSCSPQAWAAATPLLLLRTMLGIEPDGEGSVRVTPIEGFIDDDDDLLVSGLHLVDRRLDVRIAEGVASVTPAAGRALRRAR
jgi:glycogen debranching enzyme